MKVRFFLLFIVLALCFFLLIGNLLRIQAFEYNRYRKLAINQQVGQIEINALRGAIYDRNGSCLAFSVARPSIAVNAKMVTNPERTATYLALALGWKKKDILATLESGAGFAWIARKIDERVANQIERLQLPGVYLINESSGKRFYPKARIACHILGYTGVDDQGLEGAEANYEEILAGKVGLMRSAMDQRGRIIPIGRQSEGAALLNMADYKEPVKFAVKLKFAKDPVSRYIKEHCSPETRQQLNEYSGYGMPPVELMQAVTDDLNKLIKGPCFFEEKRFADVWLSEIVRKLVIQDRKGEELQAINRLLIEETYPDEIVQAHDLYIPPVPGKNIYLTIDETVQYIVEKELDKQVKKFHAAGGTVIVMDPSNGDILALANSPSYMPTHGIDASRAVVRNKAVCDNYEPGSTFKIILAAAAFDCGKVSTTDRFFSGHSLEIGGYSLRNANDGLSSINGTETVEGVITYSFNTGSAAIGLRIGTPVLSSYCESLGFGKATGVDMPGEAEGILAPGKFWKPINLATISYGHGISVTPMQMVQAYGAIANEGVMMRPRIVRKMSDQDGKNTNVLTPKMSGKPLKAKTSHEVLKILKGVCENGTGKAALVKGYSVGGKTGTANMVVNGMYAADKYIASFVGVAPIEDPRYVMLIKVDEPKGVIWGGSVAAPLFNKIGSQILWRLGVQPKDDGKAADLTPPAPEKEEKEAE